MTKNRRQRENESMRRGLQGVKVTSQRWDIFLSECFLHLGVRVSEPTHGSSLNPALVGARAPEVSLECLPGPGIRAGVKPWLFHPGRRVYLEFQRSDLSCAELPARTELPTVSPTSLLPDHHSCSAPRALRGSRGSVLDPAHSSPARGGNISLHQPQSFFHREERMRAKLTLFPLGDDEAEPRGGLRQMQRKRVHPSFLHFFIHSTNICRSPEQFLRTRRGACKDGAGTFLPQSVQDMGEVAASRSIIGILNKRNDPKGGHFTSPHAGNLTKPSGGF